MRAALLLLMLFLPLAVMSSQGEFCNNNPSFQRLSLEKTANIIEKEPRYTQGFIFQNGFLYESSGLYGKSALHEIDLKTKKNNLLYQLSDNLFGEGLASIGNKLIQLTWKSGKALIHELDHSKPSRPVIKSNINTLTYSGEGWGLTNFRKKLVMSNGSASLQFLNPETMETESVVNVTLAEQPVQNINELENVNGLIYANIYGAGKILAINPESGCVETVYDINELWSIALSLVEKTENQSDWDFVPNGIAYDQQMGKLYVTGKNWPLIFVFNHIAEL